MIYGISKCHQLPVNTRYQRSMKTVLSDLVWISPCRNKFSDGFKTRIFEFKSFNFQNLNCCPNIKQCRMSLFFISSPVRNIICPKFSQFTTFNRDPLTETGPGRWNSVIGLFGYEPNSLWTKRFVNPWLSDPKYAFIGTRVSPKSLQASLKSPKRPNRIMLRMTTGASNRKPLWPIRTGFSNFLNHTMNSLNTTFGSFTLKCFTPRTKRFLKKIHVN